MSNSPLVEYTRLSPNCGNGPGVQDRTHKISKITIHHTAGKIGVEQLGEIFASPSRQASSNYGLGHDGRLAMFVPEAKRAWTSASAWNDNRAVTIEVSNSKSGEPWPVSDHVLSKLIDVCVDICKRNGIKELVYTGDPSGSLTLHQFYAPTGCPGPYLTSLMPDIAEIVTERLKGDREEREVVLYRVQVGAFSKRKGADAMCDELIAKGYQPIVTKVVKKEK